MSVKCFQYRICAWCVPDGRARILAIDEEAYPFAMTIRVASAVGDLEVVGDSVARGRELLIKVGCNTVAVAPTRSCQWAVCACAKIHQHWSTIPSV